MIFPIVRTAGAKSGVAAISLAAMLVAAPAQAEFPGALWSMDKVDIDASAVAGADRAAVISALRAGLRRANETYFYGDQTVRMQVAVRADGLTADVFVFDALTGALLTEVGGLSIAGGADGFANQALAWMDTLECGSVACSSGGDLQTADSQNRATAPQTATRVSAAAAPSNAVTASSPDQRVAHAASGQPVPQARPIAIARAQGEPVGLATTVISRGPDARASFANPDPWPEFDISTIRDFPYSETDHLVLPSRLLPTRRPDISGARRADGSASNVFELIYDSFLSLFESDAEPSAAPASGTAALSTDQSTTGEAAQPSATWGAATETSTEIRAGRRYAADTLFSNPADNSGVDAALGSNADGTVTFANPGETTPSVYENRRPRVRVVAADAARPEAVVPAAEQPTTLTVRLDPALYAGQSLAFARRLLGGSTAFAGGAGAAGSTVTASPSGDAVDTALAARGLSRDAERYSALETVYYEIQAASPGFWIELPGATPDLRYAMLSNNAASVVALVRPGSGRIRVSDAVAQTLKLPRDAWSAVQIEALREEDAVVENASGQVFRSTRIARVQAP